MSNSKILNLSSEILKLYESSIAQTALEEAKYYAEKFTRTSICPNCGSTNAGKINLDSKEGDQICGTCGYVISEREIVETPFGRGAGGYSAAPSSDSHKLDLLTGTKHKEHGRTRKFYKTLLLQKASEEIDGLLNPTDSGSSSQPVSEVAKAMFQKYSDTLEQVRDRDSVVKACVVAARRYLERTGVRQESSNVKDSPQAAAPAFTCEKCNETFGTKQDLRFHKCASKKQKLK